MTPQLRFPEFTDKWQIKKLGDTVKFEQGVQVDLSQQKPTPFEDSVKFLRIENYTQKSQDFRYISKKIAGKKYINDDEVAVVRYGATAGFIATGQSGVLANNLFSVRSNGDSISNKFLSLRLKQPRTYSYFQSEMSGGAMPALSFSIVSRYKFAFPSKPEQEKIADFFTAVDERIAVGEKKLELLETYKRGVMQKIFSQQIRFKDENGSSYPEWEEKKLGEIEDEGLIKLGRGNVISKVDIKDYPGEYPIYSSSVKNDGLFGKYGKYMFDEELVTWSVDGGGDFFYRPSQKFSITNVSGWLRVLSGTINCKFLATQLQMLHERQKFDYTSKAHPSVIRNIYTVKIPAIEEQQKIATFLIALDDKITAEKSKLTAARQFKKALLQRMFA